MFISHKYQAIFVHIQRTGGNSIQKIFEYADSDLVDTIAVDPAKKRTKHCFAIDIQEAIDPDIFNTYTKFSIVRNPFDRMVSWYSMFKHGFGQDDRMMKVENKAKSVGLYYRGLRTINSMSFSQKAWLLKGWSTLFELFNRFEQNSDDETAIRHARIGSSVMLAIKQRASTFEEFVMLPAHEANGLFQRFYVNQLDYMSRNDDVLVDKVLRFETLTSDFDDLAQQIGLNASLAHINRSTRQSDYRDYYNAQTKEAIYQRFKRDFDYFGYEF